MQASSWNRLRFAASDAACAALLHLLIGNASAAEIEAASRDFLNGNCPDATKHAATTLSEAPVDSVAALIIAVCSFRKGDLADTARYRDEIFLDANMLQSVKDWLAVVKKSDNSAWASFVEAILLEYEGEYASAVMKYQEAQKLLSNDETIYYSIEVAKAKVSRKKLERKLKDIKLEILEESTPSGILLRKAKLKNTDGKMVSKKLSQNDE